MEERNWLNPLHPKPLWLAEFLLFTGGAVLAIHVLVSVVLGAGIGWLAVFGSVTMLLAASSLTGEVRFGWSIGVTGCMLVAWSALYHGITDPRSALLSARPLDFAVAVLCLALLAHHESRRTTKFLFR